MCNSNYLNLLIQQKPEWHIVRHANHCTTATRNAKRDFFLSTRKNPSLFWRRIKECTGLGKTHLFTSFWPCSTPTLSKASANMINKSFLDKIIALKQPDIVMSPTEGSLSIGRETLHEFAFHPISSSEIYVLIQDLLATGSTDIDAISLKMLKFAACELAPIIAKLLNMLISLCSLPTRWKIAVTMPIYKKGNKAEISNNKPISILPLISKIFQRLLDRQLQDFLENKCALSPVKHGFRKSRSCQTALLSLSSSLFCNRQNKCHSIIAALDYSKAFDTLDHQLLLHKLGALGISGKTITWFKSYLTQRYVSNIITYYLTMNLLNMACRRGVFWAPHYM